MREMDIRDLSNLFESGGSLKRKEKGEQIIFALKNENDEIVKAYEQQKELLTELSHSLKEVAYYFYGIHKITRITLCNGE